MVSGIYRSVAGAQAIERSYRELLDQWPVPNEQLRVPTREGETFVVACGHRDAPPLLLLHGASTNAALWMAEAPAWARHFRVYAVDMIGEPGLSTPSRPALKSEAYTLWLDDVLRELSVERTAIVGTSLGGWLATDYATRRPQRVERLVLLCPAGFGRLKAGAPLAAMALMPFGRWGRRAAIELMLAPAPTPTPQEREYTEFMILVSQHFRPRRGAPAFDDATIQRLDMPTLVFVGGRDRLVDSRGTQRRLTRLVPGATVRLLPDAGHALPRQITPILEFLRPADESPRSTGEAPQPG